MPVVGLIMMLLSNRITRTCLFVSIFVALTVRDAQAFSTLLVGARTATTSSRGIGVMVGTRRDKVIVSCPSVMTRLPIGIRTICRAAEDSDNSSQENDNESDMKESDASDAADTTTADTKNRLDQIMSQLTSAFPLFVLASAILGYMQPSTLTWVNQGNLISILLAAIMCGTGLTLRPADFLRVRKQWKMVPLGVAAQFSIMPLTAWAVGRTLLLPRPDIG